MKKKLTIFICLMLVVVTATGCTTFNNFKNAFFGADKTSDTTSERSTIKIGVYEPLTGQYKSQGEEERIGIELANELYPEVLGKKVELVYADNKSDMYVAETVIQELALQGPSVILGSYGETVTLAAGDVVKANNIPAISITSTNPLITVNNPYYFCATFSEARQGDALADFVYTGQGKATVATVTMSGDDTSTATVRRFTNRIKTLTENNDSVVGSFSIDTTSTDYTSVLEQIKESKAEAVFMYVSPAVAEEFFKQAEKANVTNVLYVGTKNWNDEKLLKAVSASKTLEVAYPSDFTSDVHVTQMSKTFVEAYKEKYGEDSEPTEAMAVAFDAYIMAIQAIETAYENTEALDEEAVAAQYQTEAATKAALEEWRQTLDTGVPVGRAIREALANLNDFEGASGIISFEGTNEAIKNVVINHISKGEAQEAFTVE